MKILIFGKNGQVGSELQNAVAHIGEVIALDRESTEHCGNLAKLEDLARTIRNIKPDIIINAAAYTAVDKAESEQEQAKLINTDAVAVMAREAQLIDAWLVHYSTDYVFDGAIAAPYREKDKASPVNVYGISKKAGEDAILTSNCKYLIIRTSWVFGEHGKNFVKSILALAQERETLSVVDDQIGAPTDAAWLAQATAQMVLIALNTPAVSGLYHLTNSGETSWYGYAQYILEIARHIGMPLKLLPEMLKPIPTSEYKTAAKRPANSRLDANKAKETFGITPPEWQIGVEVLIKKLHDVSGKAVKNG